MEAASWGGGGHGGSGVLPGGSGIYSHFSSLMISTLGLLAFYPGGFTDFRNLSNHPCLLSLLEFLPKAAWSSASPYLTEPELISPSGLAAALRAKRCHSCSTYWSMRGNKGAATWSPGSRMLRLLPGRLAEA